MQVSVSFNVHPLIAAAINTAIPAGESQRQSQRTVSSWRSNKAVVTARAAVFNRGGRAADGDGKVQGTRSENGSLARIIRDGEQPPEPAVINLELGDPTMYEAFWKEAGECTAVVLPGWRGMSYFSDAGGLCPFLEPEFEREVRRLHRLVGNAAVDGYHLVVGTGATQLSQAAMWALVKDLEVAKKMVYFVDRSTIGVSRDSQLRAAKILALVSDAYDDDINKHDDTGRRRLDLFDFAQRRMADRWRALRMAVASTGTFSLPKETSGYCTFTKQIMAANPAFAWLRCEKEGVEDCRELLRGHGVVVQGGERFGGDARCVRVNMLDRDGVFDLLVQRLSSIY